MTEAPRQGRVFKAFARANTWVYRLGLGRVLGGRFLMVTHVGRVSGRIRRTVLEVVRYDPAGPEWTVVAGYGARAQWLRNLQASPAVLVQVGGREFRPSQRFLDEAERVVLLADYQRAHPRAARVLGQRLLGAPLDDEASVAALAARLPAVAFRPADGAQR